MRKLRWLYRMAPFAEGQNKLNARFKQQGGSYDVGSAGVKLDIKYRVVSRGCAFIHTHIHTTTSSQHAHLVYCPRRPRGARIGCRCGWIHARQRLRSQPDQPPDEHVCSSESGPEARHHPRCKSSFHCTFPLPKTDNHPSSTCAAAPARHTPSRPSTASSLSKRASSPSTPPRSATITAGRPTQPRASRATRAATTRA
jgi:hypothetical protein